MTIRSIRGTAALALAVTAAFATAADATLVGGGAGTGIITWLSVYQEVANGHAARALCEYALNPGPTGHFEASAEGMTNGTYSRDVSSLTVSCKFYGTAAGDITVTNTSATTPAHRSHNQGPGAPWKVCLTAEVVWTNNDRFSLTDYCKSGTGAVAHKDDASLSLTVDPKTGGLLDGAVDTATRCTDPAAPCVNALLNYGAGALDTVGSDYQPGVEVGVQTGDG